MDAGFRMTKVQGLSQEIRTRTPKVVLLKVPLNVLLMWPSKLPEGSAKRVPKTRWYNLKSPRYKARMKLILYNRDPSVKGSGV